MTSQASHQEARRSTPEGEALKLWAFAFGLALVAGGIYIIGLSVMFDLGTGQ